MDRDIMLELGQARAQGIIQERFNDKNSWTTNSLGCWLWRTSLTSTGKSIGYAGLKRYTNAQYRDRSEHNISLPRNGGKNYLLHRIAFVAHYGRNPTEVVSHRCNQKNCFYHGHLLDESQKNNLARDGCLGEIRCPRTGFLIFDHCYANPRCLVEAVVIACPCSVCKEASDLPHVDLRLEQASYSVLTSSVQADPLELAGENGYILASQSSDAYPGLSHEASDELEIQESFADSSLSSQ